MKNGHGPLLSMKQLYKPQQSPRYLQKKMYKASTQLVLDDTCQDDYNSEDVIDTGVKL